VPECQKIKNDGLDQYGTEPFEQQQFGTAGVEGVKIHVMHVHMKRENIVNHCYCTRISAVPPLTDETTEEIPFLIILIVCIIGVILLTLNILLIAFFIRRRRKKFDKGTCRFNTVTYMFSYSYSDSG